MEKTNNNVAQGNSPNQLFLFSSILSWLLISVNNLASLKSLYREPYSVWNIYAYKPDFLRLLDEIFGHSKTKKSDIDKYDFPLQINPLTIYKIFNFFFALTILGCATLIYKTLIKKDQTIIDSLFGKYSRFHFIPLIFGFIMSILGEANDKDLTNSDSIAYAGLPMSLLGLGGIIFIYINTNINSNDWWIDYAFTKGTFSCLIILFWYNFCYDIYLVRYFSIFPEEDSDGRKGISLTFTLIFGGGSLAFSFVFKDIIICIINILIYNDLALNNTMKIREKEKEALKYFNYYADGTFDMFFWVCSVLLLIYLFVEKIKGMLDQMKNQITYLNSYQQQIANGVNAHTQSINQIVNLINADKKKE